MDARGKGNWCSRCFLPVFVLCACGLMWVYPSWDHTMPGSVFCPPSPHILRSGRLCCSKGWGGKGSQGLSSGCQRSLYSERIGCCVHRLSRSRFPVAFGVVGVPAHLKPSVTGESRESLLTRPLHCHLDSLTLQAGWMLLFHVLPGIKLSDSFLPNNGCFYEFLLLPGSIPHNEIFSFPFV